MCNRVCGTALQGCLDRGVVHGTRRREFVNQRLVDPRRILGCVHGYHPWCGQVQVSRSLDIWTRFTLGSRELASEMSEAGFGQTSVLAIEGPGWLLQDFDAQWADPMLREALLEVIRRTESEPSLLGASSHLLGVGRKPRADGSAGAQVARTRAVP